MRFQHECALCTIRQVLSVSQSLGFDEAAEEAVLREALTYLGSADYSASTPEIMGGIWSILLRYTEADDPYREQKRVCNTEALRMSESIRTTVTEADDPLLLALHYAAAGNLIDFAPQHAFSLQTLEAQIEKLSRKPFCIDSSTLLIKRLQAARTLLYICDNCGEIVFDKLLMEQIRRAFPKLSIVCAVRGRPVINDATREDAAAVGLTDVADIIDNGDNSAGTVLSRVSASFLKAFYSADVVLCKGQGNYESLGGAVRPNIFYLFTVKCAAISNRAGMPIGSTVLFAPETPV